MYLISRNDVTKITQGEPNDIIDEIFGYSGDTGGVSGPHLHFEIRDQNQQPINPFLYGLSINFGIYSIIGLFK